MAPWKALLLACLLLTSDHEHKEQIATLAKTPVEAVFNGFDDVRCFVVFTQQYDDDSLLFLKYLSQHNNFSFVTDFGGQRGDCPGLLMIGKQARTVFTIFFRHMHRISTKPSDADSTQTLTKKYTPLLLVSFALFIIQLLLT